MNIFENHFKEIENLVLKNKSHLNLNNIDNLKSVSLEIPPARFNFDLSCNIAMVLGKSNKLNPNSLAQKLKKLFLDNIENFADIEIAGQGFINIKLSNSALIKNINLILENYKKYGNTVSSTIPLLLKDCIDKKKLKKNNIIIACGFGVGLSWGIVKIKW